MSGRHHADWVALEYQLGWTVLNIANIPTHTRREAAALPHRKRGQHGSCSRSMSNVQRPDGHDPEIDNVDAFLPTTGAVGADAN